MLQRRGHSRDARRFGIRRLVATIGRRCRYDLTGAWVALVLAWASFTPSLLPRPPEFQGLVLGISAAIGYAVGLAGAWLWRELTDRPRARPTRRAWRWFAIVATVTGLLGIALGERWQRQLRALVDADDVNPLRLLMVPLVATVVFVGLVALARTVRTATRWVTRQLQRWVAPRAARALGVVVVGTLGLLLATGVLWDLALRTADNIYAVRDLTTPADLEPPESTLRSGGPGSLITWEDLGREGRKFTGRGPTAEEISAFTGNDATEPIRVYAGLAAADTIEDRAEVAIRDLVRAGGFERAHLLVVTATGTGWVEPSSTASFEYLTGGDSAIISMQYSHLPSWISFLVDQAHAQEAGRALFDGVYERWSALPADDRPQLYLFGESLGSFGGEAAFSGEADMRNRLDGALFAGPPSFGPLYREFSDDRDAGSLQIEPVYREGRTVRFSNRAREGIQPERAWTGTRILYLQHPSDPITWWSPDLLWKRPDWLEEPRGRDVLAEMRWFPGVTFWQVTTDLPICFSMPPEHGHTFTGEHVDGWAAVLRPAGWTGEKADELRAIIRGGR